MEIGEDIVAGLDTEATEPEDRVRGGFSSTSPIPVGVVTGVTRLGKDL